MNRKDRFLLCLLRCLARIVWFLKIAALSFVIATVVAVGMVVANYFGTHEYGGLDFQMNLVTEMVGVWASTCVTVLVVDRLSRVREIESYKNRLLQEIAMGENAIAKRAILSLRVNKWLTSDRGLLEKAYLAGAQLEGANLRGANLKNAVLNSANLSDATLTNADMRGSQLGNTDMSKTKLFGAYLAGAKFEGGEVDTSSILPQLSRLKSEILGDSVHRLEGAMQELATQLESQKELKQEIEVTIVEQKRLIAEWEELEQKSAAGNRSDDNLTDTLQADIRRLKCKLSEQEKLRNSINDSITRNEEDYTAAENFIVYGSESTAAKLDNAILPDGTPFREGMTLEDLHRFTKPSHKRFEATLENVNRIRKDMGYPVKD